MPTQVHKIFAYGSNMNIPDLKRWLTQHDYSPKGLFNVIPARLPGYELIWNYWSPARKGGAANIRQSDKHLILGAILEVDAPLLRAIDQKEGHPKRYLRQPKKVACFELKTHTPHLAWLYKVTKQYESAHVILPTDDYLNIVIEGAKNLELPSEYIDELAHSPNLSID